MNIQGKLISDMKAAMKSGDKVALETIRMIRSQIKNASLSSRKELDESEVMVVLNKEAKRRKESLEMYKKGGREDLADKELQELHIIESYLPEEITMEELRQIVNEAIVSTGAHSLADMGKVMALVMPNVKGRADGKAVQDLVRKHLS